MNIPFSINGFPIGSMDLSITDNGTGIQISNCNIQLDGDDQYSNGPSQLEMLLDTLPKTKLEQLDPTEIDLVIEKLTEIKLGKV